MKRKLTYISAVIISLLLITTITASNSEPDDTPVALVKKIVKDVTHRSGQEGAWEEAKTGIPLKNGEEVRTGYKSLALVLFTDGSGLIRVRENSILHIYGENVDQKLSKNTFIQKGKIGFDVQKQEDEEFKFTTPTAVASIRGTAGSIGVTDTTTIITCRRGLIGITTQTSSGDLPGGKTANINQKGDIVITETTASEQEQHNQTEQTETKTIKIRTREGILEIDYYPPLGQGN
ncbi:MAG: FecR family protein [Bacteroidetes bacterium]|nr:FecR family protein [Bacteroidota bacterium]MBU1679828.1 FecR family protein [Bacteroidota bacterium]MBU2507928.1 FecR family protein [Bacteroidota bacterium]